MSQRSRASNPSIRNPASREMISDSVQLYETAACFLHIQLTGRNVLCCTHSLTFAHVTLSSQSYAPLNGAMTLFPQLETRYLWAADAHSLLGRRRQLPYTAFLWSTHAHVRLIRTFSFFSCPRGDKNLRTHPTKDEACGRGVRAPGAPSCNDKKHGFNCHYGTLCLTRWPLPVRENQPHCGWYQHPALARGEKSQRAQNPPSSSPTSQPPPFLFLFFL